MNRIGILCSTLDVGEQNKRHPSMGVGLGMAEDEKAGIWLCFLRMLDIGINSLTQFSLLCTLVVDALIMTYSPTSPINIPDKSICCSMKPHTELQ